MAHKNVRQNFTHTKLYQLLTYKGCLHQRLCVASIQLWKLLISISIFIVFYVSWSLSTFWFDTIVILSLHAFLQVFIFVSTVKSNDILKMQYIFVNLSKIASHLLGKWSKILSDLLSDFILFLESMA